MITASITLGLIRALEADSLDSDDGGAKCLIEISAGLVEVRLLQRAFAGEREDLYTEGRPTGSSTTSG